MASLEIRNILMVALHFETVAHISERLNVIAANERFIGQRTTTQPFGVKLAHVDLGKCVVFTRAGTLHPG